MKDEWEKLGFNSDASYKKWLRNQQQEVRWAKYAGVLFGGIVFFMLAVIAKGYFSGQ